MLRERNRGLGHGKSWRGVRTARIGGLLRPGRHVALGALVLLGGILGPTLGLPSSVAAADPCYAAGSIGHSTPYNWKKQPATTYSKGTVRIAIPKVCWNGSQAYRAEGGTTAGVTLTQGIAPIISKGTSDTNPGGGTLSIWGDFKFTRWDAQCGIQSTGWVQLRIWVYSNGAVSRGTYFTHGGGFNCPYNMGPT